LTGGADRLPGIDAVTVHPVTEDRLDDWLWFFDHDAFDGNPEWAACYCLEPHVRQPEETDPPGDHPRWSENREAMSARLRSGGAFGYLAYAGANPAGWVNASKRSDYAIYQFDDAVPPRCSIAYWPTHPAEASAGWRHTPATTKARRTPANSIR